jgi:hypothetical protein
MVRWPAAVNEYTHLLGADVDGPYAQDKISWVIGKDGSWENVPVVYMIRANVKTTGETISYSDEKTIDIEIETEFNDIAQPGIETENYQSLQGCAIDRDFQSYIVYRLQKGETEENWAMLANDITTTEFTDTGWDTLAMGMYQYAVKAEYGTGLSLANLSKPLPRLMTAQVTVNASTNNGDSVTGAVITLTEQNGEHEYGMGMSSGTAVFAEVWKGTYNITVTLDGFYTYAESDILINEEEITIEKIVLVEKIITPFGLEIEPTAQHSERLFSWNNYGFEPFYDSFEDEMNWIDWYYADLNGYRTKSFGYVVYGPDYFTGSHAFMIQRTPLPLLSPFDEIARPRTGKFYLVSFSSLRPPNNGWVFTQKLNANSDITFKFWAKSVDSSYGYERFRVGYSTIDITSFENFSPDNFVIVTEEPYIEAPVDWTEYSYIIPGSAKYIGVNCVSDDALALMIDDIDVGFVDKTTSRSVIYKVYLDDIEKGVADETSFNFTGLETGTHIAGVKAVFKSGETATVYSKPFTVSVGINEHFLSEVVLYPNPFTNEINIDNVVCPVAVKSVWITNAFGQDCLRYDCNSIKRIITIPAGGLSSGVYFVVIESEDGDKRVCKMVKR